MKDKLKAFFIGVLLGLLRIWPWAWIEPFSRMVAAIAPRLLPRDRRLISSNVQSVYGLRPHSGYAQRFQRQVLRSQLAVAMETFKYTLWGQGPLILEGLEDLSAKLEEALAAGKGVIVVTAHTGSWELVAQAVAKASQRTFYALAKPSKSKTFTAILKRMRSGMNTEVLWTDSKNLLREMIKTLQAGQLLGFVMDQKPEGRIGPLVSFLGRPTEFVSGPAKLAIRHQSAVLAVFCMRAGPGRYKIYSEVVAPAHHGLFDEQALTQAMARTIEACIRLYPEQWVWNYKRWRQSTSAIGSQISSVAGKA